jgi:hypothetical protein
MPERRGASSTRRGQYHSIDIALFLLKACPARSRNKALSSIEGLKISDRAQKRGEMVSSLSRDQSEYAFVLLHPHVRLKSGNLYVGLTTDLEKRYEDHCCGKGHIDIHSG